MSHDAASGEAVRVPAPLGRVIEVLCKVVLEYRPELLTLPFVLHGGLACCLRLPRQALSMERISAGAIL